MRLYITYGLGSNLANRYSVVEDEDYAQARARVNEVTGGKFAFTYSEKDFQGQPEKYGLREVPLQPQVEYGA